MIPHFVLIQSTYRDAGLSRRRLDITKTTCVASLIHQTVQPILHVTLMPDDPFLEDRKAYYLSTGCECKFILRKHWRLYRENWELPEGRKIVSRMDDDDVIANDFCESTRNAAPATGEMNLVWPNGFVFWREQIFRMQHRGNQFVSLVTDRQTDPHQDKHYRYYRTWPTRVVSMQPGWIWIRHGDAASSTLGKYRRQRVGRIDAERMPINLRAVLRAIANSGQASSNYREHTKQMVVKHARGGV